MYCGPRPTNVLPAIVCPPKCNVNHTFQNNIQPVVHPSHTTTVNHVNTQFQHYFPHTQSVVNTPPTAQNVVAGASTGPGFGPGFGPGAVAPGFAGPGFGPGAAGPGFAGPGFAGPGMYPGAAPGQVAGAYTGQKPGYYGKKCKY